MHLYRERSKTLQVREMQFPLTGFWMLKGFLVRVVGWEVFLIKGKGPFSAEMYMVVQQW